jgi:RNA polymerase sigma-70 factor (ECF subfamily)
MKQHEPHDLSHCIEMFEKLSEYIDGEVDAKTCEEIERHIDACLPCKICLATLKQTVRLCQEVRQSPVPEDVSDRIHRLIEGLQKEKKKTPPVSKTVKP